LQNVTRERYANAFLPRARRVHVEKYPTDKAIPLWARDNAFNRELTEAQIPRAKREIKPFSRPRGKNTTKIAQIISLNNEFCFL
jgi:hypothetical protein